MVIVCMLKPPGRARLGGGEELADWHCHTLITEMPCTRVEQGGQQLDQTSDSDNGRRQNKFTCVLGRSYWDGTDHLP